MCDSIILIRGAYVASCNDFWARAPVRWSHQRVNDIITLPSAYHAKQCLYNLAQCWNILGERSGEMFLQNLYANCDQVGSSLTEHVSAQYQPGRQNGSCKYILVVIYRGINGCITISYAFHNIIEHLVNPIYGWTPLAGDIITHWLKAESVRQLTAMMPFYCPTVMWE